MYFLYILRCSDESLYTGITTDIERRLREHKDRSSASKHEAEVKNLKRAEKLSLIKQSKNNT